MKLLGITSQAAAMARGSTYQVEPMIAQVMRQRLGFSADLVKILKIFGENSEKIWKPLYDLTCLGLQQFTVSGNLK